MIIEDLIHFDVNELPFRKLILRHYKPKFKVKLVLMLASGLILMLVLPLGILLPEEVIPRWVGIPILLTVAGLIGMALKASHNMTRKIMEKKYKKALTGKKWDYRTVARIRVMKIAEFMDKRGVKPDIGLIIDSLKYQKSKPRYSFTSHTIILSFVIVIVGAYLAALFQLPAEIRENRFEEMTRLFKVLLVPVVVFGCLGIAMELTFIREYWEQTNNRYDRLIRTLENYRLTMQSKH